MRVFPNPGGLVAALTPGIAHWARSGPARGRWRAQRLALRWVRSVGAQLGVREIATTAGFWMRLHLQDWVDQHIYATGEWEPDVAAAVMPLVRPGHTVIDIGSNVGYFALWFAQRVHPTGSVVAFEPVPTTRGRLLENLALNPALPVAVCAQALSDRTGVAAINEGEDRNSGTASLRESSDLGRQVQIDTARLDDLWPADRPLHLVKIDVEGWEAHVIAGMAATLDRWRPTLLIEVSDSYLRQSGSSAGALCAGLIARGYRMRELRWDGAVEHDTWHAGLPDQFNALFMPR